MIPSWMIKKISHFGVKYSNSVLTCLSFIIIPLVSEIQIKVLINYLALLSDLFGNSEGAKLLIWTVIFVWCLLNSVLKSATIVIINAIWSFVTRESFQSPKPHGLDLWSFAPPPSPASIGHILDLWGESVLSSVFRVKYIVSYSGNNVIIRIFNHQYSFILAFDV